MNEFSLSAAAKAYLAAAAALASYLMGVLDPTALGLSAFATVTTVQWLGAATAVMASFGIVWSTPNKQL